MAWRRDACFIVTDRVVIVGAGVAGLVVAIALSAAGHAVTVLERAALPGGKMRQIAIGNAKIDSGPTVFTMRWVFDELFAQAGKKFSDAVTLEPLDVLARHAWPDGSTLDLFADENQSVDAIGRFAGRAEALRYKQFCAQTKRIYDMLEQPFLRAAEPSMGALIGAGGVRGLLKLPQIKPFSTMWTALGQYFHDPRLRQLFGRYATYCGSSPFEAPGTLMLVAHVEQQGVWSIKGGMGALATSLATCAKSLGAIIRYDSEVSDVLIANDRASGVVLANGERIAADAVVINADVAAVAGGLFGTACSQATTAIPLASRSLSAMTWSLTARTQGFSLSRHNVFFSRDYKREFDDIFQRAAVPSEPTVYVLRARSRCARRPVRKHQQGAPADPHQCARDWRPAPIQRDGGGAMRAADIRDAEARGPANRATSGYDAGDDPKGFQRAVSGDGRGLVRPQLARFDGVVSAAGRDDENSRPVSGGRQHASGAGRADGGAVWPRGGGAAYRGPHFDQPVPHNGYAWWYIDALSDDGENGITIIAFIGSVFSPYYAFARRRRSVDPLNHCAINVALYRKRGGRWAMTERPSRAVTRSVDTFRVGPSALHWDGTTLTIDIDELTVPIPSRLRGRVRVTPAAITSTTFILNANGNHRWWPIAPVARVDVAMQSPDLRWQGDGYLDHNAGDAPIELGFRDWQWARGATRDGAVILYEGERRDGSLINLAKTFDRDGHARDFSPPAVQQLKRSGWRVDRAVRSEADARVVRTLEDAPFYARSVVSSRLNGENVTLLHESLSLDRFRLPIVQAMLPFRMPRARR